MKATLGIAPWTLRRGRTADTTKTSKLAFQGRHRLADEAGLAGQDLVQRLRGPEPADAVDLGKGLDAAGARRPFHLEQVGAEAVEVWVGLDDPGVDHLAALLAQ